MYEAVHWTFEEKGGLTCVRNQNNHKVALSFPNDTLPSFLFKKLAYIYYNKCFFMKESVMSLNLKKNTHHRFPYFQSDQSTNNLL